MMISYFLLVLINRLESQTLVVTHLLGFWVVTGVYPSSAGVPQLSEWPALLEKPSSAFCFLLRQTIQGFLTSKE